MSILDDFGDERASSPGRLGHRPTALPGSMPETRDARRVLELLALIEEERRKRIAAERQTAGLRSTITRLNVKIARLEARIAEQRALC
jgi:hypothetical protein